jgi:hypothetical protein
VPEYHHASSRAGLILSIKEFNSGTCLEPNLAVRLK